MEGFLETLKTIIAAPIQAVLLTIIVWLIYELVQTVKNNTKAMSSLQQSVVQEGIALSDIKSDVSNVKDDVTKMKSDLSVHCSKVDAIEKNVSDTKQTVSLVGYKVDTISKDVDRIKNECVMREELSKYVKGSE